MGNAFTIRSATTNDVALIHAFIRDLARYEKLEHEFVATEDMLREKLFGSRPCAEVLILFEDAEPAAFALFFQNFSTFLARPGLHLEDLFVRPPFRRRGYARALLKRLAQLAVERGCGRFEWTVLDWNKPAIAFYESIGTRILPDWRVCRLTGDALARFGE